MLVVTASTGMVTVPVTEIFAPASPVSTTLSPAIGVSMETVPPIGAPVSILKFSFGD